MISTHCTESDTRQSETTDWVTVTQHLSESVSERIHQPSGSATAVAWPWGRLSHWLSQCQCWDGNQWEWLSETQSESAQITDETAVTTSHWQWYWLSQTVETQWVRLSESDSESESETWESLPPGGRLACWVLSFNHLQLPANALYSLHSPSMMFSELRLTRCHNSYWLIN